LTVHTQIYLYFHPLYEDREKIMSSNTVNQTIKTDTLDLEVQAASHAFAQALAESPEFQAFEQAGERLSRDETAQNAIQAFQKKQQSLQMIQMLNAVSPEDQLELDRLRKTFIEQ
jgi:ribosomal protein L31